MPLGCLLKEEDLCGTPTRVCFDTCGKIYVSMGHGTQQEVRIYDCPAHDLPVIKAPHSMTSMELSVKVNSAEANN